MKNSKFKFTLVLLVTLIIATPGCNQAETILAESGDSAQAPATSITWFRDVDAAKSVAKDKDVIMMVDVYTDWCHWCKELDKKVFTNSKVIQLSQKIVSLKVDAEDNGMGTRLARMYGVSGYPTILFIGPDGQEVDRIGGFLPADQFAGEMERIISGRGTLATLMDQVNKGTLSADEKVDAAVKLMQKNRTEDVKKVLSELKPDDVKDADKREMSYLILTDYSFMQNEYVRAERYLTDYVRLYPASANLPRVHVFLVYAKIKQKDEAGAREYLKALKEKYPGETQLINQAEAAFSEL